MIIYLGIGAVLSLVWIFMGISDLYYTRKYSPDLYDRDFIISGLVGWGLLTIITIIAYPLWFLLFLFVLYIGWTNPDRNYQQFIHLEE